MNGVVDGEIIALDRVEARVEAFDWAFARERADEIAAHWAGISAGKPATKLAANDTRQLEPIEAPAGSAFVPITWQYDAGTFGDYSDYAETDATTPTIDLVADKASYRVPAPETTGDGADSFYVLVAGDGEDASLSVEYDGVTQTVDLTTGERDEGRAAPLYDLKPRRDRTLSCTKDSKFKTEGQAQLPDYACEMTQTARIPYAGGAWAPEGGSWLVFTLTTTLRRYETIADDFRSGATYVAAAVRSTFTLGKLKPTKVIEDNDQSACPDPLRGGCVKAYHVIFEIDGKAPSPLRVDQTYDLTLNRVWGGADGRNSLKLTNRITVKG